MKQDLPKRKQLRWDKCDYSTEGRYFITICTQNRKPLLSRIHSGAIHQSPAPRVGADVLDGPQKIELSPFGKIIDRYLHQLDDFYETVKVDQYVIMPNHIHLILFVSQNGPSGTSAPTRQHSLVSQFVSTLKRFSNKEIGANIWQRSYFDHVIRDGEDYQNHLRYLYENPEKWQEDDLYVES